MSLTLNKCSWLMSEAASKVQFLGSCHDDTSGIRCHVEGFILIGFDGARKQTQMCTAPWRQPLRQNTYYIPTAVTVIRTSKRMWYCLGRDSNPPPPWHRGLCQGALRL